MRSVAAVAVFLTGIMPAVAVEPNEEPIITFHTTVYENTAASNAFHIILGAKESTYVDVDCGYGPIEEEITQAVYNPETQEVDGTFISCSVTKEGIVKVYGDASLIDYVYMEGCYIDEISFPKLTEVSVLNLEHNLLKSLDLSHMTKLQALYISDNPFNESPLIVGGPKPELAILEMSIIGDLDPNFDITGYPALVSMEAWHVPSLKKIDPTKCPQLLRLSLDVTGISSIDVSKNTNLLILNVSQTNVTSLDVTHNPYLTELYCTNGGSINYETKLNELDVTQNPELQRLFCGSNNLTTLDLSKNPKLQSLSASYNHFKTLDIEANEAIFSLDLSQNDLDFVTLPAPRSSFDEYYYAQRDMPVDRSYAVGTVLDFTDRVIRKGSQTAMKLFRVNRADLSGGEELGEDYYSYENGKVTLLKECPDSLYISFYNTMFMAYPLSTRKFMVKSAEEFGKPSAAVTIGFSAAATNLKMSVGIAGATPENPVTFYVDFGKGTLTEFQATSSTLPETPNVTGKRGGASTVIYIPEGCDLTAFGVSQGRIATTDFSAATQLRELVVNGTSMKEINLKWNNLLTYLNLDNNSLTYLDLDGANARLGKNYLSVISAANNKIGAVVLNDHSSIIDLNLSNNNLQELLLDRCFNLVKLNVANNYLESIDLNDCESLTTLDCSHNNLTALPVPTYCPLNNLDITYNDVTFAMLAPAGSYPVYKYAPQNLVQLPTKAPSVNLRDYLFTDANGLSTAFVWRTVDGNNILTDKQISEENGFFRFLDTEMGEVYCTMTHPAFPEFTGDNVYKTTNVMAAEMPKNLFCSFTTKSSGRANLSLAGKTNGTVIYIDWKGNGNLEQYILKDTYKLFSASFSADANVKCYSYEEDDNVTVFSVEGVKVTAFDASPMKQVQCFSWTNSNLGEIDFKLPSSTAVRELILSNNGLTKPVDVSGYPALMMYNLTGNKIESLDISSIPSLKILYAGGNGLNEVKFDNPLLWDLSLENNQLESIDLSKLPSLNQVRLSNNKLSNIDFTGLSQLRVINIDRNYFTFATLPVPQESWNIYNYRSQNPMKIEVVDGVKVDLSSQLSCEGNETTYVWYIGTPWYDEEGNLTGEELILGEEYTIENGVTTFLVNLPDLMCVMTNPVFPGLYLYTYMVDITEAGIDEVMDSKDSETEYYNLSGIRVKNPTPGIYIRRQGNKATKVLIH